MADAVGVVRYVDSMSKAMGERSKEDLEGGFNPFITISREAGASGRSLAEAVLKAMEREKGEEFLRGWQIFDQELCRKVAQSPAIRVSMQSLLAEEYRNELADYISQFFAGTSPQSVVLSRVFETVRSLASLGKVILVGRAGALLTRNLPHGIHARLVASWEGRVRIVMRAYQLDRKPAERKVKELDASRAKLVKTYFKADVADPLLYDAVFNTDTVPLERIAAVLVAMVRDMKRAYDARHPAA